MEENNLNDPFRYTHKEFLRTMLFYLRTPAVYIDGFSEILAKGDDGSLNPKQTSSLDSIRRSSRQLHLLLDVFSYVLYFDEDWRLRIYKEEQKLDNLSQIVYEAVNERKSFGSLRIDPSIEISCEIPENIPSIIANTEWLIIILRLMVMSVAMASYPCLKILIKAQEDGDWLDIFVVANSTEIYFKFDALKARSQFSDIYESIDLEVKEHVEKNHTGDFFPTMFAVIHGLSNLHGAELRTHVSKSSSTVIFRLPIGK